MLTLEQSADGKMDLLALGVVRPFLGYGPGLSDHPTRSPQRGGGTNKVRGRSRTNYNKSPESRQ